MRNGALISSAIACMLAAAPAAAQDAERYTLQKTENGYVRMDTATGAVSTCEERNGQLTCRAAADERTAFQDEIDRLEKRVEALEARLDAIGGSPSSGLQSQTDEEEFEKALGFMERFFRRFVDIVKDLEKDFGTQEDQPGKTRT